MVPVGHDATHRRPRLSRHSIFRVAAKSISGRARRGPIIHFLEFDSESGKLDYGPRAVVVGAENRFISTRAYLADVWEQGKGVSRNVTLCYG